MFGKNKQSAFWSTLRPQTGFWLGLVLGVLLMFVVGFFVLLGLVINQEKNAAAADDNVAAAADQVSAVNLSPIGKDEPVQGDRQAKVVLIEFSDFQCPNCARVHETLKELVSEYGDNIARVYRSFPLDSIHAYARSAAEASECASDQDKFWEYADALLPIRIP
jgi:protein-disulfide isomerase